MNAFDPAHFVDMEFKLFDMVDHPDAQEEMMNFNLIKNGNVLTTHAVPLKLTTTQTIITAGKLMEVTDNLNSADVAEASSLRNELLALMVLLCLLILGVVIYFVFRSMVYIKKEKAQERLPINNFAPINLP